MCLVKGGSDVGALVSTDWVLGREKTWSYGGSRHLSTSGCNTVRDYNAFVEPRCVKDNRYKSMKTESGSIHDKRTPRTRARTLLRPVLLCAEASHSFHIEGLSARLKPCKYTKGPHHYLARPLPGEKEMALTRFFRCRAAPLRLERQALFSDKEQHCYAFVSLESSLSFVHERVHLTSIWVLCPHRHRKGERRR